MKKSKSNTAKKQIMRFIEKQFPFTTSITRDKSSKKSGESHYHILEIELQYIRSGSGAYFIKDRKYHLKENSILIIHKGEVHNYIKGNSSIPVDRVYLAFNPSILFRNTQYTYKKLISHIAECKKNFSHQISFPPEESQRADLIISNMTYEWENKKLHYREAIVSLLLELFIIIHRSSSSGTGTDERIKSTAQDRIISKVISYIDKNYQKPLDLATLGEHVFRSPYHLSHIFKDVTGFNFKEYLINKRIMKAKNLLESESDIKVISVAEDVGFLNLSTFNRDFKRLTGISPSEYRKFCTHFHKK